MKYTSQARRKPPLYKSNPVQINPSLMIVYFFAYLTSSTLIENGSGEHNIILLDIAKISQMVFEEGLFRWLLNRVS